MKKLLLVYILLVSTGCTVRSAYHQKYYTFFDLPEVTVNIRPAGIIWRFQIRNNTDDTIRFLIDDSTYVRTDGIVERLIRGETRLVHRDKVQPAISIPPGARFSDYLIQESVLDLDYLTYRPPTPADPGTKAKFYLVFEINGARREWACYVDYVRPGQERRF